MERITKTQERENTPTWVRPNLRSERGEIERVLKDFVGKEPTEDDIRHIMEILEASPLVDLSDEEWQALGNTDSFHNVRPTYLEDAKGITEKYNEKLPPELRRNFENLLAGFVQDGKIEAPTILRNEKGEQHLISGNTRLMIARALGARPKVVIGEYGSEKTPERILSRNEIMEFINRHSENATFVLERSDEQGIYYLEAKTEEISPGEFTEYMYTRKGTFPGKNETAVSTIHFVYYKGGVPVPGGHNIADYNPETGQWEEVK